MVAFSPRRPPQSLSFYIRRSARYYLLFLLLAAFISLGYISDQQSRLPSAELQPPNDNDDDHSKVVQSNVEHAVDAFVRGFPRLRGPEVRGVPVVDGLDERGEGEERTVFDWPKTTHMFVFGDSYSTLDKNYRKNGVDGGHEDSLHHKATDMKWTDYLYAVFHDFHSLQYYNFARVGAVIDPAIIPPGLVEYGSYPGQITDFQDLFIPRPWNVQWQADNSLFIVFFGINDLGRMNREDLGRLDVQTTSAQLARSLVESNRRLYSSGARSFLIVNIPPIQFSPKYNLPGEVGYDSHELIAEAVSAFNENLAEQVDIWKDEVPDGTIMLFDLEKYWRLLLAYPEMFGLTDCSRYSALFGTARPNMGRMGFCYHDNQHISWSSAELVARTVHGFLLRHSASLLASNATENALYAQGKAFG